MVGGGFKTKKYIIDSSPPRKRGRPRSKDVRPPEKKITEEAGLRAEISNLEKEIANETPRYALALKTAKIGMAVIGNATILRKMEAKQNHLRMLKTRLESLIARSFLDNKVSTTAAANDHCCPSCKSTNIADDDVSIVCMDCGTEIKCSFNSDVSKVLKYGESPYFATIRSRSGGYRPIVHFGDILGRFQGSRVTFAPEDIVKRVREYCIRYKYKMETVGTSEVKFFLKMMQQDENDRIRNSRNPSKEPPFRRYTDYYKYAFEIANVISGKPLPLLSKMQCAKILEFIPLVIAGYKKTPRYRSKLLDRGNRIRETPNNPNNYYIFYKVLQLLGYDNFLPYIPLPKNTENIDENDLLFWKPLCEMYGWQYIPTI